MWKTCSVSTSSIERGKTCSVPPPSSIECGRPAVSPPAVLKGGRPTVSPPAAKHVEDLQCLHQQQRVWKTCSVSTSSKTGERPAVPPQAKYLQEWLSLPQLRGGIIILVSQGVFGRHLLPLLCLVQLGRSLIETIEGAFPTSHMRTTLGVRWRGHALTPSLMGMGSF